MGGIGKTTLSLAYAGLHINDYEHIAWIQQTEDFANSLLATELLLENLQFTRTNKPQRDIVRLLNQLSNLPGPSLLILDNAEVDVNNYLDDLPGLPNWHVIITSRERLNVPVLVDVPVLPTAEAVTLFLKHYTLDPNEEIATQIVEKLDGHTLTIEILAKTAQARHIRSAEKVLNLLQDRGLKIQRDADFAVGHSRNVKVDRLFNYLLSIFQDTPTSAAEIWLIKQFLVLPSVFIPFDLLAHFLQRDEENEEEWDAFTRALQSLRDKGWLIFDSQQTAYKMHLVVQEVFLETNHPTFSDVGNLVDQLGSLLSIDETKDNPVDKFQWIPYTENLLELIDSDDSLYDKFLNNLAMILKSLGDYAGAKGLLEKALRSAKTNLGADHLTTALRYSNLAIVLKDLGDYAGAKDLLKKAVQSAETNLGADHLTTALRYSNLALVLKALGDYAGAKGLLEKALQSHETNLGADHPKTAVIYSNLATVLQALGDYAGAKGLLEKALRSAETNLGADHPMVASRYSNLAIVLKDLGDYAGAKGLLEKALQSHEANLGADHPRTAVIYSNLATVLKDLGDYAGAKGLLEKALRSAETNLGADHPTTAISYSNLALVLKALGDYAGAKGLLEKALRSAETNFGADHPTTAVRYWNLAAVEMDLEEFEKAKDLLDKAHRVFLEKLGPEHPYTKRVISWIDSLPK